MEWLKSCMTAIDKRKENGEKDRKYKIKHRNSNHFI